MSPLLPYGIFGLTVVFIFVNPSIHPWVFGTWNAQQLHRSPVSILTLSFCPSLLVFCWWRNYFIIVLGKSLTLFPPSIYLPMKIFLSFICNSLPLRFRTYDNLASYEPGNMEYRGRAYSTEVGTCPCGPMQVRIRIDSINLEGGRQKQKYPAGLMKSGQKIFLAHLSSTPRGTRCNHSLGPTCSTGAEPRQGPHLSQVASGFVASGLGNQTRLSPPHQRAPQAGFGSPILSPGWVWN